jgi:hypothetical protein
MSVEYFKSADVMPADFFVFVLYCSRLFVSLQQKTNELMIYEATTIPYASHADVIGCRSSTRPHGG